MKLGMGARVVVAMAAAWVQPSAAQEMTAQAVKAAAVIDIPFILGDVNMRGAATSLWSKGDQPDNLLLANLSILPVQVAQIDGNGPSSMLWRAFAGGGISVLRADELDVNSAPRYFCGTTPDFPTLSCFLDEDANGSFDHVADAIAERGTKPYHLTIIKGVRALDKALSYHIVADDQRPAISIELRNCAKDYDRPRFVALSTADRNAPVMSAAFGWHAKDSSFAYCRRGKQIASVEGSSVVAPNGGYIGEIGPLAFTVGPKENPQLALIGPADGQALYRLEGASLVNMSIGHTPNQAQLLALKKFPYPFMMADEGATIQQGLIPAGRTIATIPFHHAYRGKLTQDIKISTLFGKRSLSAGTVVYGFPAQSRLSLTRNGIPEPQVVGDDEYRKVNLELTWCAPVHGPEPEAGKEKPKAIGKGGWSAACIPHSRLGSYTIITDMQPAFSVSGVSYNANTSSNDGSPPVDREDGATFEQPLRLDYVYQGREDKVIILAERIYFGDQLTSEQPIRVVAFADKVAANIAGMPVELSLQASGELSVRSTGSPVVGVSPALRWDQRALLRQQFQKMGLVPNEAEAVEPMRASE